MLAIKKMSFKYYFLYFHQLYSQLEARTEVKLYYEKTAVTAKQAGYD